MTNFPYDMPKLLVQLLSHLLQEYLGKITDAVWRKASTDGPQGPRESDAGCMIAFGSLGYMTMEMTTL